MGAMSAAASLAGYGYTGQSKEERFATYNGSDPRRAPGSLSCVAHVEMTLGGFGVEGGIHAVVRALMAAAHKVGVRVHLGARVSRLTMGGGRVDGLVARTSVRTSPADVTGLTRRCLSSMY